MDCDRIQPDELAARYLLGALSTAEQDEFEQHYFGCESCFAQLEEEEDQLLTRYTLGDVTEQERRQCEEHFLRSAARQEQLAAKRALFQAIRAGSRPQLEAPPPAVAARQRGFAPRLRWAAAAIIVLLSAATGFFALKSIRTDRALRFTEQRLVEAERARRELQRQMGAMPPTTATPTAPNSQQPSPAAPAALVNPPFLQLFPATRAESGDAKPATVILTPRNPTAIFYLEYETADPQRRYHLALQDGRGRVLWEAANASPRNHSSFIIALPAGLLRAGQHAFQLGAAKDQPLANYSFRVTRR